MLFHVDDPMLTHTGSSIVTKFIKMMDKVCGNKDPLVVTRGKINEFLGMSINLGLKMGVGITQYDFIKKDAPRTA